MFRTTAALLLLASAPAHALELEAWGVGPHIGTNILPGAYPSGFPNKIAKYDFDGDGTADDLDGDGTPDATTLEKVRGDFEIGADAYLWVNSASRVGLLSGIDLGSRFTDVRFLLNYDYLFDAGTLYPFVGGAVGAGSSTWRGEGEERLRTPTYPLRAQAGVVIPDGLLGYQARVYGQWNLPARHVYTAGDGSEQKVGPGLYLMVGAELTVLFGDMDL